jgi:hypothetical protein
MSRRARAATEEAAKAIKQKQLASKSAREAAGEAQITNLLRDLPSVQIRYSSSSSSSSSSGSSRTYVGSSGSRSSHSSSNYSSDTLGRK